jgi:hypothetical protein
MTEGKDGPPEPSAADSRDAEVRAIKRGTARAWQSAARTAGMLGKHDEADELAKKARGAIFAANTGKDKPSEDKK